MYDACLDAPVVLGALLIDEASSSAGVCGDDSAEDGREMELAVEASVDPALDFLVEPSVHLPNALLRRLAGRSPLPPITGGVVGLSALAFSDMDTTTVDASLREMSVAENPTFPMVETNSSCSLITGFFMLVTSGVIGLDSSFCDLQSDCT